MKALLLIAHGSRRIQSNDEIAVIAGQLAARMDGQFESIRYAFLELAEPSISAVIDQLVADGSAEIVMLPYFLSAGRHVYEDIPEIIEAKKKEHSNVTFWVASYLGEAPEVIDVLARLSQSAEVR